MLIERILAAYDYQTDPRNPISGSRLGACQRALAYQLWPGHYPPEPLLPRRRMVFEMGHLVEDQLRGRLQKQMPGQWGMEEERFHFKVPLTTHEATIAARKATTTTLRLWLTTNPAEVLGHGLTLDTAEPAIYVPLHVDGIVDLDKWGLTAVELKSYSTPGFRRLLAGKIDYTYRVQLAVTCEATGLDNACWLMYRKETSHLLELFYSRHTERVTLRVRRQSGAEEVFVPGADMGGLADVDGFGVDHPFESGLLEDARRRVKAVLLAEPREDGLPAREYGPVTTCAKCGGQGFYLTPKRQDRKDCKKCAGKGMLKEVALPFPCSYCDAKRHCWPIDRVELTREAPTFWVKTAAIAAIPVAAPEVPEVEPEEEPEAEASA